MKMFVLRSVATIFASGILAYTAASAQYPAPQLTDIASPSAGQVAITMSVTPGAGGRLGAFLVYRREGTFTTPDDFDPLTRNGYLHYFMDTLDSPEFTADAETLTLTASGLKRGVYSFYVTQVWGLRENGMESAPSNVLVVNVGGHDDEDGDIEGSVVAPTSSVPTGLAAGELVLAYPNPAAGSVHIPFAGTGPATVRIFNTAGVEILNRAVEAGSGECIVDVAGFTSGEYYADVVQGARTARSRFAVVH